MADGSTTYYAFTLPEVGASEDSWGTKLNANWTSVDTELNDLETLKADLAAPTFTGVPAAPTAAVDTNTTQLATTAFVVAQLANDLAVYAPLASPALTGNPTAPTQTTGNNTTRLATTAFVQAQLANDLASYVPTSRTLTAGNGLTGGGDLSANRSFAIDEATAAEYRNKTTGGQVLTADKVWDAAAEVTLTDAPTIAVDMSTFLNSTVTLGASRTLGDPTNAKPGQSGVIRVVQDATGSRLLTFGVNYEFAEGSDVVLSTGANDEDLLFYHVISATRIFVSAAKNIGP